MPAFANMGTWATFAVTGGQCNWIPSSTDADRLGVPKPDANGCRGAVLSPGYFKGLILVGLLPSGDQKRGWKASDFAAHWPKGTPP
jgi:hypothetical protein